MGIKAKIRKRHRKSYLGFTIVDMLVVIILIGILAGLVIVAYNGIQQYARNARVKSDVAALARVIQLYGTENGSYPITTNNPKANWRAADVYTDSNCSNGSSQVDWIPGVKTSLPQSLAESEGVDGIKGCYIYVSDGQDYVISAWNMLATPQTENLYRRLGFREFQSSSSTQFYTCNVNNIGGVSGNSYNIANDYYKHSYTISNIKDCDETPPPGA